MSCLEYALVSTSLPQIALESKVVNQLTPPRPPSVYLLQCTIGITKGCLEHLFGPQLHALFILVFPPFPPPSFTFRSLYLIYFLALFILLSNCSIFLFSVSWVLKVPSAQFNTLNGMIHSFVQLCLELIKCNKNRRTWLTN